jgi:hypothetical protein
VTDESVDRHAGVNLAGIHEPRKSLDPGFEHAGVTDETGCFVALSMTTISLLFLKIIRALRALRALRGKKFLRVPSGFFFV